MPQTTQGNKIQINNMCMGGLSDSMYLGIENSLHRMVGWNLHGEPGVMKVNQKSTKISATTVTEFIKTSVVCSNGEVYLFSADSGKIWRIKADDTVQLCYTTAASTGEHKCLGADEYNGYILWYTQNHVHRISTTNALVTTWATLNLNWKKFNTGDINFHPSAEVNLVLYIADKNGMTQLDGETFTQGDVVMNPAPPKHRICAMQKYLTDLCYGTFVTDTVNEGLFVTWNTWSLTPKFIDDVEDIGVNSFLKTDNYMIAQVGKKGGFAVYNNQQLQDYRQIPGIWDGSNTAIVHPDANVRKNKIPYFGLSNISGNPALCGIYSIGGYSPSYPKVINLEHTISYNSDAEATTDIGEVENVEIGAIFMRGTDMFFTWKHFDGDATYTYGVDKIDTTAKINGAYFDTRVITNSRGDVKTATLEVFYRTLNGVDPDDAITAKVKKTHGEWETIALKHDASRKRYYAEAIMACAFQFRIIAGADGNDAPEIENVDISY